MDIDAWLEQLGASKRILVLGCSGSGKTTFSRCLGRLLDIETIHLDAHFWKPGWIPSAQPQWREAVAALVARDSWIMDGTYESTLDLRIPAADALIVIESSRWACLWRVIKRKVTIDDAKRSDAPPGQPLDRAFLRYIWRYPAVTRPVVQRLIEQHGRHKTLVVLRAPQDTRRFIQHARRLEKADGESPPSGRPL